VHAPHAGGVGLTDFDVGLHAGLLVSGDGAVQLVFAALEGDGEVACLAAGEGRRGLLFDAGSLDGEVMAVIARVADMERVGAGLQVARAFHGD